MQSRIKLLPAAFGLAVALALGPAQAAGPKVEAPWARATVAAQRTGGAYLRIDNAAGAADRLIGASSAAAERVELHTMSMQGDVMRMRQVDAIDVPAGEAVELKPGGQHLMLVGLKAPLRDGETIAVELRFEKAGTMTVSVPVRTGPMAGGHGH
jgi:copper(I)-binding protein